MLEMLNQIMLDFMDLLLGWMLNLPMGLALAIVAVGTSVILTFVRVFTTNQDLLQRCKNDKKRLKELLREAKAVGDKDAVARIRATTAGIAMKTMSAEFKPLVVAIIPIALLAVWAFGRLAYIPPPEGDVITVKAYFPVEAEGNTVHMMPTEGVASQNGLVQEVRLDPPPEAWHIMDSWPVKTLAAATGTTQARLYLADGNTKKVLVDPENGMAIWQLKVVNRDKPYKIELRYKEQTYCKELIVDGRRTSPVLQPYDNLTEDGLHFIELGLKQYRPYAFGAFTGVPGIPGISDFFPPWLVGYLIITIPVVFALRWLFNIN